VGIISVKDIFFLGIAMNVRNMMGTRFWLDKYCSNVPLGQLFPDLFSNVQHPAGPVSLHWMDSRWNIKVPHVDQEEQNHGRRSYNKFFLLILCTLGR